MSGYQFGSARYGYTQVNGVQCFGNESHLITCRGGTWERNWCLSDNAGVVCTQTGSYIMGGGYSATPSKDTTEMRNLSNNFLQEHTI